MLRSQRSLRFLLICLLCTTLTISGLFASPKPTLSFGQTTLQYGSRGGDVYELQGRLKFIGFYKGAIDGHYGWQTYQAVRTFQSRFGLRVDGVAGAQTKSKLSAATKAWRGAGAYGQFSSEEMTLLARTVHGEARGEPYTGQVAVAAVILNRLESPLFPNTISGIIYQPGAFTAVDDGQIWLTPNATSYQAVRDAVSGWDPAAGALYYFNPVTATSKWIWSRPQIKQIGRHIFCK
jgi:N-acetylmuramoyl-L-alanine amidase